MGFSLKKVSKKVLGKKVTKAVTKVVNTKNLAYAAPYASAFTTAGRRELKSAYGGIVTGLAGQYGGEAAAGLTSAAFELGSPTEAARSRAEALSPEQPAYAPQDGGSGGSTVWVIVGVVVAGVVGLFVFLKRKRK